MTAIDIPDEVAAVLRAYFTCEITTVNKQGQPMTWPAVAYFDQATGEQFLTVSIAFPVKAYNARRRPQISLLYSDPTGSGLSHPPAVLVQGDATVAEALTITPHVLGLNRLIRGRQPDSGRFMANKVARRLFAWYLYQRIGITVRPRRLTIWEDRDFHREPTVIEVVNVE